MEKKVVIGLMSGTSLDGLDLVCAEFVLNKETWSFRILAGDTVAYDEILLEKVRRAIETKGNDVTLLDLEYGHWLGKQVEKFIVSNHLKVDLIASHGQTIFHDPAQGISLQIGDGQSIANICKVPVINNFREADVKMGGQGAPLVPIGDLKLFPEHTYFLNLGGIANVSIKKEGWIEAFDVSVCNAAANYFAALMGFEYDFEGSLAKQGVVSQSLLDQWNSIEYFHRPGPKSLDASFFKNDMLPMAVQSGLESRDCLRTLYEHIGFQLKKVFTNSDAILTTGGGAHNSFLIQLLQDHFKLNIHVPEKEIIELKEALIFAFMGLLKWRGENNVLASVTGSPRDHSSGWISRPV